jgi:hypothetical protein
MIETIGEVPRKQQNAEGAPTVNGSAKSRQIAGRCLPAGFHPHQLQRQIPFNAIGIADKAAVHDRTLVEITGSISPFRHGVIATQNPVAMADCDQF